MGAWHYRLLAMLITRQRHCTILVFLMFFLTLSNIYILNIMLKNHKMDECKQLLTSSAVVPSHSLQRSNSTTTAWIVGMDKKSTHLTHIINAFNNFETNLVKHSFEDFFDENWDIMWSHRYPFFQMRSEIKALQKSHCINHIPGSGFVSNKAHLATSSFDFVPKAFKLPSEKDDLMQFAAGHPDMMFVQKSNDHRGIKIEKISSLDLDSPETFVQEFIHTPLLIDGHKFDIGVYTIVTSVEPLRVYIYEGDVLFRFCPEKYFPFSPDIRDKYVVGSDYLPLWKVPSLSSYYLKHGFSMKGSFDAWLSDQDKDPEVVWNNVRDAIRTVFYEKEEVLARAAQQYPSQLSFFEMMRFDFIVAKDMKVYLMEANMSPNLSSEHFKQNRLLYEQVAFNLLSLVGVPYKYCSREAVEASQVEMRVSLKDVAVFPTHCNENCHDRENHCNKVECQLCHPCITFKDLRSLKKAYLEHTWRGACRRIVPEPVRRELASNTILVNSPPNMVDYSPENTLMTEWFRGKCLQDTSFCS